MARTDKIQDNTGLGKKSRTPSSTCETQKARSPGSENQCMGCQANWPLIKTPYGRDLHKVAGGYPGEVVGCTGYIYE